VRQARKTHSLNPITLFLRCIRLLEKKDQRVVWLAFGAQLSLIILDLIGISLFVLVISIATSAIQGRQFPQIVDQILQFLSWNSLAPQQIAGFLGGVAALCFIAKSILSFWLTYKLGRFLASREKEISVRIFNDFVSLPVSHFRRFNSSQFHHSVTNGSRSASTDILGGFIALCSEIALQIFLGLLLFVISPSLFLVTFMTFSATALTLNYLLGNKVKSWAAESTLNSVRLNSLIHDVSGGFREISVSNRSNFFISNFAKIKERQKLILVRQVLLPQISKNVYEISLIVMGLIISGFAFWNYSAVEAASTLALFVASASRLGPSIFKLQSGWLNFKGAAGATDLFFEVTDFLAQAKVYRSKDIATSPAKLLVTTDLGIELSNVTFFYPSSSYPALQNVSMKIHHKSLVAIVGASGSGKSTLVDMILGLQSAQSGQVTVFGIPSLDLRNSNIKIGYVPQDVHIMQDSLQSNVCFGVEPEEVDMARLMNSLKQARLSEWVNSLQNGIETILGERATSISGGQRQRIGIARALYNNPHLLVFDESTSSLDSIVEYEITATLQELSKEITTVIIAHRLSTIVNADKIFLMNSGQILGEGSFGELRSRFPDFERQANLMGL